MRAVEIRSVVFSLLMGLFAQKAGAVNWHDDLNITADVVDQNLDIAGTNQLTNAIYVAAITTDVLVTVAVDSVVTSTTQLYFYADAGREINVEVEEDLMFRGSSSDFLITFSGSGNLTFLTKGGATLSFTSLPTTAGALFYIINTATDTPNVTFRRFPIGFFPTPESDLHAFVRVGGRSAISFAAPTATSSGLATEVGTLTFNGTQNIASSGRLILDIPGGGGINMGAYQINNLVNPTLADINTSVPAGLNSVFNLANTGNPLNDDWSGLLIQNGNLQWPNLEINPFCEMPQNHSATAGFVLRANSSLNIADLTYLDYVVTQTNVTLDLNISSTLLDSLCGRFTDEITKDRNPAALIIDGSHDPLSTPAAINLSGNSAIYFRSAVNCQNEANVVTAPDQIISYTIAPDQDLKNEGTILLDVEGQLEVNGTPGGQNVLNILSIFVNPVGGSVFIEGNDTVFPLRTFARDGDGKYVQYGSGCFLVNNRMNFKNASLQHTDVNHLILEDNIIAQSAPTYVGGESRSLGCPFGALQNRIAFYNGNFLVHTSAAASGVDFLITNSGFDNSAEFRFYYNGRCIDQGTGRNLIFGTDIGSLASDFAHIINRDSHLDIMQEQAGPNVLNVLNLTVAPNNTKVTEGIVGNILNQFEVNTLFLGWASNISIGTNGITGTDESGNPFPLTAFPELFISGDYFSFTTQGGTIQQPEESMTSGEGGMFVDTNGVVAIAANRRASMGMMVTKSRNGSIDLPKSKVLFSPGVGIAQWRLNLSDPTQLDIIPLGESLSDYSLDWRNITKNYCMSPVTVPYELPGTPAPGQCPPVVNENLIGLPIIHGSVEQMQIKNARLGDQAQLIVDGGLVREMVFLTGNASATAPTGFLVLQNDAIVGLGSADRNVDSLDSAMVLGVNGVTLVANGNGTVHLNKNTIVNNVCHIITGTLFGANGPQQLVIDADVPRELRIKSDGVLDLTPFINANQQLVIAGQVKLIFEPGAKLLLGAGTLIFTEQASAELLPFIDGDLATGVIPSDTDAYRVKWVGGTGLVSFEENSRLLIPRGALLGVETDTILGVTVVDETWQLLDAASIDVGTAELYGGGLQIGNVLNNVGHVINFNLILNGIGATVAVNSQGFLGFSVGIVDKQADIPNNWRVDRLFNVNNVALTITEGTLASQQIYLGNSIDASLLAFGPATNYTFTFDRVNSEILGGGNTMLTNTGTGFFNPTVVAADGFINPRLSVGLLSSRTTLLDTSKLISNANPIVVGPVAAPVLFNFLKMNPYANQNARTAAIFRSSLGETTIGYVDGTTIYRPIAGAMRLNGALVGPDRALVIGAAGLALNNPDRAPALSVLNP